MFQGVLFDLDGVITDTSEYHYQAWKTLAEEIGISIDRTFNEQLKGISREESLNLILAHGEKQETFSASEKHELMDKKNSHYHDLIASLSEKDVYPGILSLLKELQQHKIRIALASASRNAPFLLQQLKLTDFFESIADPALVRHGKPAPDLYLLAAENIGLSPSVCIGIEDAKAGIESINRSGAFAIGVGTTAELGEQTIVVSSTRLLTYDFLKQQFERSKQSAK